ncbi:MAG TPA: diacylglycerol kinase family protein [Acidimicrobiales bacterium]|nr:diacylglycerol kinase family protein [Acidimicrobiales bacterium]
MGSGRFARRAALRATLAGTAAAPLGAPAAAAAAVAGAAQEEPRVAAALGAVAAGGLAVRSRRGAPSPGPARTVAARVAAGAAIGVLTRFVWPVAPEEPARVAPQRTWRDADPSVGGDGVAIVVNPGAGTGAIAPAPDPATALRLALPAAEVVELAEGEALAEVLDELAAGGCRALGVAGGDGSINTAAGVALRHGLPLVVVPAGTLNHLARDLGVETVEDAVAAVRRGEVAEIDVGRIAGRPFLNTASFGSYVELVDAREALEHRIGKWPALAVALVRVLRRSAPIEVALDGDPRRLWLVFVGNCRYQPEGMAPTWRERLDDGRLDVRVVDAGHPFSRTRLALAAATGTLRRSRVFETWAAPALHVRSGNGPLRLARDGETFDGDDEFDIAKPGDRLAVFTPRNSLAEDHWPG